MNRATPPAADDSAAPAAAAADAGRTREFRFERKHFNYIAGLIYQLAGIHLAPHKVEMMYSRLARRLRELHLTDFDQYCELLGSERGEGEIASLVNALTTNLTRFFREPHHFEHLSATTLPQVRLAQSGAAKPRLRIWSAGCSSGQEPYTLAMAVAAAVPDLRRWDARILATDIDTQMIEMGRRGVYTAEAIEDMPAAARERFMRRTGGRGGAEAFSVAEEVRALVTFKPLNLLETWPMKGPFDAIFCRNVLIYFDKAGRSLIVDRFADLLGSNGFLYLGHSENLHGISRRFALVGPTIYRRVA